MTEGPTTSCDRCGQQFLFALELDESLAVIRRLRSYKVEIAPWEMLCTDCLGELLQHARLERLLSSRRGTPKRTP